MTDYVHHPMPSMLPPPTVDFNIEVIERQPIKDLEDLLQDWKRLVVEHYKVR